MFEKKNCLKERSQSLAAPRFALSSDDEAEAAIEARLLERGDAANPFTWISDTPPSLIEQRRNDEKMKHMHVRAANINRRVWEARQRGEPLPSDIPYDDRQEQVLLRKMDVETKRMVQKVKSSRNSYKEVTSVPGAVEALCKSAVMRNYVFC